MHHAPAADPASTPAPFDLLLPPLQQVLTEEKYHTPTPIQAEAIPHLLKGTDLIGIAQTGTGKTAAFTLPLLHRLTQSHKPAPSGHPRALILAPTRELAAQIGESIATYGRHLKLRHTVIFGGVGQHPQVKALRRGVDILVATPGRLLDLMNQRFAHLNRVEVIVLDEADRMLDMGFMPDVNRIVAKIPRPRQSLLFSATMPEEVRSLAHRLVHDAVTITIAPAQPAVERITQKVMYVDKPNKLPLLVHLLESHHLNRVVVFTRTKNGADKVTRKLEQSGITVMAIHGNKSQTARTNALHGFRRGRLRVLVATDIASRGIDVDDVTHVINFDIPEEPESYVHRIGRTARAGANGDAISLCSAEERSDWKAIEKLLRTSVPVESEHPFHDEKAQHATGAAARRPPRGPHRQRRR